MPRTDSALSPEKIARCRALVSAPRPRESIWPPLGAAVLLAASAIGFAAAMIAAPPVTTEHVAPQRGVR